MRPEDIAETFSSHLERGLSASEAERRLAAVGPNMIESTKRTARLKIFFNQFKSPLILILLIAAIVTLVIAHYRDAVFIFIAVVVNSILGFYQENKAERALAELKTYLRERARVIRDGKEKEIDASELVPGDVVRLSQGDRVPADARLFFVNDFQVDEAVLTGESLPVSKTHEAGEKDAMLPDQKSMVFAGTLVTQGIATAMVCRTGKITEFGKIASLIALSRNEKTPLQKAIIRFSTYLTITLCVLTALVFIIGLLVGYSSFEMFLTSIAIAVSAIPEGLPISLTIILAVGVERMAKRKGVVRKLVAAEALGSTTIVLTDKTGTLTMATMVLSSILPFRYSEDKFLSLALSNANVLVENPEDKPDEWRMNGRIMETALVRSACLRGSTFSQVNNKQHVLQSIPFNAEKKFSFSLVKDEGKYLLIYFGAPDILLGHSVLEDSEKQKLLKQVDDMAFSGERVLGLATKQLATVDNFSLAKETSFSHMTFEGFITFRDPVRHGIKEAIMRVEKAGVKTVIVTGDHKGTAVSVAREVGMVIDEKAILDATELGHLSEHEIEKRLPFVKVIARVTPFDKLRIARLYQKLGEVVAMTGDGVNDAPSIKEADVGIAMGSGTEVAQSVADLVLLDDNFETIVAAIEEGRQIVGNIRKVLAYLLSNVLDGLVLIGGSLLAGMPLPLNALQILWVNFFTDSFPAVSFAFEREEGVLDRKPVNLKKQLFDPLLRFLIFVIGITTSVLLFVVYFILIKRGYDSATVQTFIFAAFGTYTLMVALSVRSLDKSILSYPFFSNKYLLVGICIGILLMAAGVYLYPLQKLLGTVPLSWEWLLGVLGIGALNIVLIEFAKLFFRLRAKKK